ncbi:uncharacterized protein LOC127250529 [Andrographis paniculata]|uniref:uncharacterized protein LOC127250529 n=1 Tax=Andrographis paniculata TaxID=175694 RepID=UPI0021E7FDC6|nr:uncharacterized protein LOC127250529 [Andrographis paniculata]
MVSIRSDGDSGAPPECDTEAGPILISSSSSSPIQSPARISFSTEFLDESNFISICPDRGRMETEPVRNPDQFEFLSGIRTDMMTADELFREGKLLPFWQVQHIEKLDKVVLKSEEVTMQSGKDETRIGWFLDEDPSPRPPKCTVLWKELLRLKKQRANSTLSPSSSSSSSSSGRSTVEITSSDDQKEISTKDKIVRRVKKGVERTRSASIRIRPMIHVPICTQGKINGLPPLFSLKKSSGKLESI